MSRDRALLAPESVEMLVKTLVEPAQKLPRPRRVERAVYRLSLREADLFPIALPEDARQRLVGQTGGSRVIEVRRESWQDQRDEPPPRREHRVASSVLQSDDPLIRDLAKKAGGDGKPADVARRISTWVHRAIEKKSLSVGLATASEVARDLTGDCTEHAVLAAAMARAQGIPARVAMGLVYVDGVFGYHMWTEVFDNGWHGIDPALGQEATDATHIKLAESSLEHGFVDDGLIGLIQLISRLHIDIIEYEIGGQTFDAEAAPHVGAIRAGAYSNPLFGIRLDPPDGWQLYPQQAGASGGTLLRLEGPLGIRGELTVATGIPDSFRLTKWVTDTFDKDEVARVRNVVIAKKPGRRLQIQGSEPEILVAFLDRDTLYRLSLRPGGAPSEAALDDLVAKIELRKAR